MAVAPTPTERELEILKILWERGEATVREVYEELRKELPIVQNTVQAFLRTMEEKRLVRHRVEGRSFIYRPTVERQSTNTRLASQMLSRVFDGAIDQLVQSVFDARRPTSQELQQLEAMLAAAKKAGKSSKKKGPSQ